MDDATDGSPPGPPQPEEPKTEEAQVDDRARDTIVDAIPTVKPSEPLSKEADWPDERGQGEPAVEVAPTEPSPAEPAAESILPADAPESLAAVEAK